MRGRKFSNRRGSAQLISSASLVAVLWWITIASEALAQSSTTNNGDAAHKADVARLAYGVNGSGVKVCVISDSIDDAVGSLETAQDLQPVPAVPDPIDVLPGQAGAGKGEGLGMLEIVHKIAPGASLGFATSGLNSGGQSEDIMSQNIRDLADANCKIIVDDFTSINNTPFQDGKRAIAINEVTARGVLYVASSGNYGNKKKGSSGTWEGDFAAGDAVPASWLRHSSGYTKAGIRHAFGPGTYYVTLTRPTTQIGLYWSDPWGSSTEKYRLYVRRQTRTGTALFYSVDAPFNVPQQVLFASIYNAPCASVPGINCFDVNDQIYIAKEEVSVAGTSPSTRPSEPRFLRLDVFDGEIDAGTNGSTFGHSAAETALTVAAADMPSDGGAFTHAATVSRRSSDGLRRIFFEPDGTPIPPGKLVAGAQGDGGRVLNKPDLTAAACATTVWPAAGNNVFCGTSAAAPYVAGIAALILSYRPNLTPAQVRDILVASAIDIEDAGWDDVSGYGIPMADTALMLAGSLQFGPKLEIIHTEHNLPVTIRLNSDRSVTGWPVAIKASAIGEATVLTPDGALVWQRQDGTPQTMMPAGSGTVAVAPRLAMSFKNDGTAQVFLPRMYTVASLPVPDTSPIKDAVGGTGDLTTSLFFLKRNGKVERWAWRNTDPRQPGEIQLARTLDVDNVIDLKWIGVGDLDPGDGAALAILRRDGTVVTTTSRGDVTDRLTGDRIAVPRPSGVRDVVAIAAGFNHVIALKKDGTVIAWGGNSRHQCDVPGTLKDVVSIAATGNISYALTSSGQLVRWGTFP